jgi:hypothetical protein
MLMVWASKQETICSMSHCNTQDYTLYRVSVLEDTKRVSVSCLGIYCLDKEVNSEYECIEDLPTWIKERISVLMMLTPQGHKDNHDFDVGYRTCDTEFFIYVREIPNTI